MKTFFLLSILSLAGIYLPTGNLFTGNGKGVAIKPLAKTEVTLFTGGSNWGGQIFTMDIAFGDIDGDGRDEIGVVRAKGFQGFNFSDLFKPDSYSTSLEKLVFKSGEARFIIYDDAKNGFKILHEGGKDWGEGNVATSIAFGDVDGDGKDEIGVTRFSKQNARYFVLDGKNFKPVVEGGKDWGNKFFATDIAFGNVDGDKAEEFAVGRFCVTDHRLWLYDDKSTQFKIIGKDGSNWGSANTMVTSLAFGDVDGDGRMELGATRQSFGNDKYFIYRYNNNSLTSILKGGDQWGDVFQASDIGFGDIDGDGRDEFAVTRYSTSGPRYFINDDEKSGFKKITEGGNNWGAGFSGTTVAFGDMNGDKKEEMGLGRLSPTNERYWIRTFKGGSTFEDWVAGGNKWGGKIYPKSIAFGDVDGDGKMEYGIARHADTPAKFIIATVK